MTQHSRAERSVINRAEIESIVDLTPELLRLPAGRMWTSCDQGADVLYINFKKPSHADDSELLDSGILVRYEQGEVSSAGESHPDALSEPYVNVSAHTAPARKPRRTPSCQ